MRLTSQEFNNIINGIEPYNERQLKFILCWFIGTLGIRDIYFQNSSPSNPHRHFDLNWYHVL